MDHKSKETHCVSLLTGKTSAAYFDSFGIECIPQEVQNQRYIYNSYI